MSKNEQIKILELHISRKEMKIELENIELDKMKRRLHSIKNPTPIKITRS